MGETLPSTLEEVLQDEELREKFGDFVNGKGAVEYLLMYEIILEFEREYAAAERNEKCDEFARRIIFRFLTEGQYYVKIEPTLRDKLLQSARDKKHQFPGDTFDECKEQLLDWMRQKYLDDFLEYKRSGKLRSDNVDTTYQIVSGMIRRVMVSVRNALKAPLKGFPPFPHRERSRPGKSSKSGEAASEDFIRQWV